MCIKRILRSEEMTQITLKEGQVLNPDLHTLYLIIEGKVTLPSMKGRFFLKKGDTIGVLELFHKHRLLSYLAEENTILNSFSINTPDELNEFFESSEVNRQLLISSTIGQINSFIHQLDILLYESNSLYETLIEDYKNYVELCQKLQYPVQVIKGFHQLKKPSFENSTLFQNFYTQLSEQCACICTDTKIHSWCLTGLLYHCSKDSEILFQNLKELLNYQKTLISFYINEENNDLLSLNLQLLSRFYPQQEETPALLSQIKFILTALEMGGLADPELLNKKNLILEEQNERLTIRPSEDSSTTNHSSISLIGSLEQILSYSTLSIEEKENFRKNLNLYKGLSDKASSDDRPRKIYKQLTNAFLSLYKDITLKALEDSQIPLLISMFLYFGYVDEELAGLANAESLANLAQNYFHQPNSQIYTFFDWVKAIYTGEKEPSRNEFDEEYSDIVHQNKIKGIITAEEEKVFLKDGLKKVEHELDFVFPQVNKMTYGRIISYCPVFSEHNILRPLSKAFVSEDIVEECIQKIREIDFQAFYRETIYTNPESAVSKEFIHIEALPDIILMPNTGIRGAMWQEIENRRRTTPCRMMLPIFYLEDLQTRIIHLAGEFRWEMCKRVQGAHWNDLTESSLTSEYCDYLQFYRKNSELSPEAKEKIKNTLSKTKNNFKEMFVLDYISWILYESSGSPRLNKIARTILFTYCPFKKEIREQLITNPLFRELLERYNIKNAQRVHHLDILLQKISNSKNDVPSEIQNEYDYTIR